MAIVTDLHVCGRSSSSVRAPDSSSGGAQEPPELTQPVNDFAKVIDPSSAAAMDSLIRSLERASGDVIVVVTVDTYAPYGDIREYAVKLFENKAAASGSGAATTDCSWSSRSRSGRCGWRLATTSSSSSLTAMPAKRAGNTWCPNSGVGNTAPGCWQASRASRPESPKVATSCSRACRRRGAMRHRWTCQGGCCSRCSSSSSRSTHRWAHTPASQVRPVLGRTDRLEQRRRPVRRGIRRRWQTGWRIRRRLRRLRRRTQRRRRRRGEVVGPGSRHKVAQRHVAGLR